MIECTGRNGGESRPTENWGERGNAVCSNARNRPILDEIAIVEEREGCFTTLYSQRGRRSREAEVVPENSEVQDVFEKF